MCGKIVGESAACVARILIDAWRAEEMVERINLKRICSGIWE